VDSSIRNLLLELAFRSSTYHKRRDVLAKG